MLPAWYLVVLCGWNSEHPGCCRFHSVSQQNMLHATRIWTRWVGKAGVFLIFFFSISKQTTVSNWFTEPDGDVQARLVFKTSEPIIRFHSFAFIIKRKIPFVLHQTACIIESKVKSATTVRCNHEIHFGVLACSINYVCYCCPARRLWRWKVLAWSLVVLIIHSFSSWIITRCILINKAMMSHVWVFVLDYQNFCGN